MTEESAQQRQEKDQEAGAPAPAGASRMGSGKWLVLVAIALVVCVTDQASKAWAQDDLYHRPGQIITLVRDYVAFRYVENPGAAWGFLSGADASFRRPFFICISLAAMVFILSIFLRLQPGQRMMLLSLSLILGGAIGNFIDRLRHDYVVDFIRLHWGRRFYWPTFNVADVAISIGVFLLLLEMFFGPWWMRRRAAGASYEAAKERQSQPEEAPEDRS